MADGGSIFNHEKAKTARFVSKRDVRYASNGLVYERPEFSCAPRGRQRSGLVVCAIIAGWCGLLCPAVFLAGAQALSVVGFGLLIFMRLALVVKGGVLRWRQKASAKVHEQHQESVIWPRYSVLVPLYKEAGSVPKLVEGLKAIDYPLQQLEVFFLVEREDGETQEALRQLHLPAHWPVLVLPDGKPRTKPRALNVALERLTGQFLTIYDAEDRPHPDQLKSAVRALQSGGYRLACVQAPLRAYNDRTSWVSGQWALEYDVHFGLILPALADAKRPIALGGTSNHFRGLM